MSHGGERFCLDEIDDRGGELLRNKGRKQRYDSGLLVKLEDIARNTLSGRAA
jgi:hypothetical protein